MHGISDGDAASILPQLAQSGRHPARSNPEKKECPRQVVTRKDNHPLCIILFPTIAPTAGKVTFSRNSDTKGANQFREQL
jgi:hypothetical protein